jgi:predicted phage terminase large subunit-like protein
MRETTKKLFGNNLLPFAMKSFKVLTKKKLIIYPYVRLLAEHLEGVAIGETRRLVITLPPRHLKTFLASTCLAAWILAHNPSAKILLVSYNQELADRIAYDIRAILQSDFFLQIFKTRIAANRTRVMDFVTTAGGGVRSVSIEGGVTGLGADYIFIDDPLAIKDSDNARLLDRIAELFDSEIRTRLDNPKRGAIVITAHRLNRDDLPGHVLREGGWTHLSLPLVAPRTRKYDLGNGEVWIRKKGDLLRPDAFTQRDIERLRASRRPSFEILQQQNPDAEERLRITADHFPMFTTLELPHEAAVVLSIDPNQKGTATNSFAVVQAWVPSENVHFLLDQRRVQANYRDFRSEVWRFIRKYRPSVVLIEDTGQGPAVSSEIRPQTGMEVVMITPVGDKIERIRRHLRALRAGLVRLPMSAPWRGEFIEELTTFPCSDFDDQVDALTQFLDYVEAHPHPQKRPPRGLCVAVDSRGRPLSSSAAPPAAQVRGVVVARPLDLEWWRQAGYGWRST